MSEMSESSKSSSSASGISVSKDHKNTSSAALYIESDIPDSKESLTKPKVSQGKWENFKIKLYEKYLSEGVSIGNFFCFLFVVMMSIAFFVFLDMSQTYVIRNLIVTGKVEKEPVGTLGSSLTFFNQIISIFLMGLWGVLSDKIGRKNIYAFGFFMMAIGISLYPWATAIKPESMGSFFSSLYFFRFLFAVGSSATSSMLTAVLSDYAHRENRGKLSALVGFCSGIGALIGVFGLYRITAVVDKIDLHFIDSSLKLSHSVSGILSLITSIIAFIFLQAKPLAIASPKSFSTLAKEGLMAMKNPEIGLSYFGSFLARADSVAGTLFIPMWIDNYYRQIGLCEKGVEVCKQAVSYSSSLTGVGSVFTLVGAPIFGILAHKFNRLDSVLVSALIGVVGYSSYAAMDSNPKSGIMFLLTSLSGLAQIGMIITSMVLVSANADPSIRGSVSGYYSLIGGIGILFITKVGGVLFDSWIETSPFVILGILHGIMLISTLVVKYFVKQAGCSTK